MFLIKYFFERFNPRIDRGVIYLFPRPHAVTPSRKVTSAPPAAVCVPLFFSADNSQIARNRTLAIVLRGIRIKAGLFPSYRSQSAAAAIVSMILCYYLLTKTRLIIVALHALLAFKLRREIYRRLFPSYYMCCYLRE